MAAVSMSRKRKAVEEESAPIDPTKGRAMKKSRKTTTKTSTKVENAKVVAKAAHSSTKSIKQEESTQAQAHSIEAEPTRAIKRQRSPELVETPRHKRVKDAIPPTPEETPTRGASRLFDRLNLVNTGNLTSASKNLQAYQSPPETPHSHALKGTSENLPAILEDTKQQFTAFLNAHSLFVAHHGTGSPNYLNELIARVTRTWRKRAVAIDDIRRLLGVLGDASPFTLVDNGEGVLCLELKEGYNDAAFQTKQLTEEFARRFERRWLRWNAAMDSSEVDGTTFLSTLPLAPIVRSEVASDPTKQPKGALRLAMMKDKSEPVLQPSARKIQTVAEEAKTTTAISSRGTGLLDRIIAKQQLASTRPSGPTKEEVDRQSALDRIEDVARVLDFLAGGRPRASFSMQILVQHLQNSARNPIAKDEAERCIELMAKEVCPRYVSVVRSGNLHGVVVTKMGRPMGLDLKKRLDEARSL